MAHLFLAGAWLESSSMLAALVADGHTLTWGEWPVGASPDLAIVRLDHNSGSGSILPTCPWFGWNTLDDPDLTARAYDNRALLVLPCATPPDLLVASVRQLLKTLEKSKRLSVNDAKLETFPANFALPIVSNSVLEIVSGVVAQYMIHDDGVEVLLGLYGSGHWLTPHPDDTCLIELRSHTPLCVRRRSWETAGMDPACSAQLRHRIWQMEAWMAGQARPVLEDRILSLLQLLSEQFGVVQANGILIDVRVTHSQLASAIGASRTTVTRLLSSFRKRGILRSVGTGSKERFFLLNQASLYQPHH